LGFFFGFFGWGEKKFPDHLNFFLAGGVLGRYFCFLRGGGGGGGQET